MADPGLTIRAGRVALRSTRQEDLPALMELWNDGRVMELVGFPNGLGYDAAKTDLWFEWMCGAAEKYHFAVYADAVGFCGEVYCNLDRLHRRAKLDIKFRLEARGKRLSREALGALIRWVFESHPDADAVWTEPWKENLAARTLYYSCGLRETERPADLRPGPSYWQLKRADWSV